jgi:hypothetical protein
LRLEEVRELGDGGLARAVHTGKKDHEGLGDPFGQGPLERGEQLDECGLQLRLELTRVLQALVALRLAKPLDQALRGGNAHVRAEELTLEIVVDGVIDGRPRAQHVERAFPAFARALEVLLEETFEGFHTGGKRIFSGDRVGDDRQPQPRSHHRGQNGAAVCSGFHPRRNCADSDSRSETLFNGASGPRPDA